MTPCDTNLPHSPGRITRRLGDEFDDGATTVLDAVESLSVGSYNQSHCEPYISGGFWQITCCEMQPPLYAGMSIVSCWTSSDMELGWGWSLDTQDVGGDGWGEAQRVWQSAMPVVENRLDKKSARMSGRVECILMGCDRGSAM